MGGRSGAGCTELESCGELAVCASARLRADDGHVARGGAAHMGDFSDAVYEMVGRIPRGTVATYGQIARLLGRPRSARYVGFALRRNPQPGRDEGAIPCHRVVFADGRLCDAFVFGGPDVQFELLREEGVRFVERADGAGEPADGPCVVADIDDGRGMRRIALARLRVDMRACQWSGHDAPCAGAPADDGRGAYPTEPPAFFDWEAELGQ